MDEFVRLMHTDLAVADANDSRIDIGRELLDASIDLPEPRSTPLKSAFEVRDNDLRGPKRGIEVDRRLARAQLQRFARLAKAALPGAGAVFNGQPAGDLMLGTARLPDERVQPFSLELHGGKPTSLSAASSPIGVMDDPNAIGLSCAHTPVTVGLVQLEGGSDHATVEEDVLLGDPAHDESRVAALIERVARVADTLEHIHLPGQDETIEAFRDDLTNRKARRPKAASAGRPRYRHRARPQTPHCHRPPRQWQTPQGAR